MAREIHTEVTIHAPASRVWAVLTDFARYPDWNPFLPEINGRARAGERLRVLIQPPEGKPVTFRPRVLVAKPEHELRWLGRLAIPGLFDGNHRFVIEPAGEGRVRFVQSEHFTGLLVPLVWGSMGEKTRRGFELMNEALKRHAEAG